MSRSRSVRWLLSACAVAALVACSSADDAAPGPEGVTATDGTTPGVDPSRPGEGTVAGVDCGVPGKPDCQVGAECTKAEDCASRVCDANECQPATCTDLVSNGDESGVDCGGATCKVACKDGDGCKAATDCESQVCGADGKCAPPSPTDEVKNGDETDVDCGGTKAPKCVTGQACLVQTDCEAGCAYTMTCADAPTCTVKEGGDSCGEGATGAVGAKHESCCASPTIPRPAAQGGDYRLDKYLITAGRMRAFFEAVNGDVRGFVSKSGSKFWNKDWNAFVPDKMIDAHVAVGPYSYTGAQKDGCYLSGGGMRTFWLTDAENALLEKKAALKHPYPREVMDELTLNCVDPYLMQAMCIWDGGHLATEDELKYAWVGGAENRKYAWGNKAYDLTTNDDVGQYKRHHSWNGYNDAAPFGNVGYIFAPGRFPQGNGRWGQADLSLSMIQATGTFTGANLVWIASGSWDVHALKESAERFYPAGADPKRAYWALAGRCAR